MKQLKKTIKKKKDGKRELPGGVPQSLGYTVL